MKSARLLACLLALASLQHAAAQSLEVWTDKQTYSYGEEIRVTATLANSTERTLRFHLSVSEPRPVIDGFWAWGMPVSPMEIPHELAPGEALVWKRSVPPALSGLPETDGWHRLRLTVATSGFEDDTFSLADSILFAAPRYLGGQIEVNFADADTAFARAVRDSLGAEITDAAAFGGNHFQKWRFEGTALADAVARYGSDPRFGQFTPYRTFEETAFYKLPARRPLAVSVDTLRYPEQRDIVLTNVLSEPVTITRLSISRFQAYAWRTLITNADTTVDAYLNAAEGPDAWVGLPLDPGASLTVQIESFDPCIICKTDVLSNWMVDTLRIYTDASGIPDTVILDPSGFVSAEAAQQPGTLQARVYPNPARDAVTVEVDAPAGRTVTMEVFDALGRRVALLANDAPIVDLHRVAFDASRLPPGLYLLRVSSGGERITRPLTLVR